jgi:hypothetical protein
LQVPAFYEARAVHYEIHALVDGRWRIDAIVAADGVPAPLDRSAFEKLEAQAIAHAAALLTGNPDIAAVRVIRERRRADGFTTSREIFAQEAPPPPKEAPLAIGRLDASAAPGAAACASLADLYRRDACRMISLTMRSFLDRLSITPLELLHHFPYQRKLEDNWGLVAAAVSQVAQSQANSSGENTAERALRLNQLIDQAMAKARDAQSVRRLPVYDGNFQAWANAIARLVAAGERVFYFHVAMARHLVGMPGHAGRLEFALGGLEQTVDDTVGSELDAFAAGCLESPQLVMDLLGRQTNLAGALLALAELAQGRPADRNAGELAQRLRRQLAQGALPACVPVLWERIARELIRAKPLSRDRAQEWALLMQLRDELPPAAPPPWGEAIEAALGERARQVREAAA